MNKEKQNEEMANDIEKSHWKSEGKWIDRYNGKYSIPIYECSVCKKVSLLEPHLNELGNMEMIQALSAFCPHCGTYMKGGTE